MNFFPTASRTCEALGLSQTNKLGYSLLLYEGKNCKTDLTYCVCSAV